MILALFIVYLLILIGLARSFSKKLTGLSEFFLAGQNLPTWMVVSTFVASWIGAASTIGTFDKAYNEGISAFWYMAVPSVFSVFAITFIFSRRVNKLNALSMPKAIEDRYGPIASLFLALVITMAAMTFIASQLVATGQLLQACLDMDIAVATWVTLAVIVIYSVIGGFRAVVMTDVFQVLLMWLAIGCLFTFSVIHGPSHMGVLPESVKVSPEQFWDFWHDWPRHVMITFTFVLGWSIAPEMWQRMRAVSNETKAFQVGLYSTIMTTVMFLLIVTAGILSVGALTAHGVYLDQEHHAIFELSNILPLDWLSALVMLGIVSAVFSSMDSGLNICSLTLSHDIVKRYFMPKATDAQLVLVSQVTTVLAGIPAVMVALHYQDIIQVLWISADIYASTIFVPVTGLFYFPKAPRQCGLMAIVLGLIPVLSSFLRDFFGMPLPGWFPGWPYTTLVGVAFSLIGFFGAWWWYKDNPEPILEASQ